MKKRITAFIMAAVMIFSLAGCGGGNDKGKADGSSAKTENADSKTEEVWGNDAGAGGNLR